MHIMDVIDVETMISINNNYKNKYISAQHKIILNRISKTNGRFNTHQSFLRPKTDRQLHQAGQVTVQKPVLEL